MKKLWGLAKIGDCWLKKSINWNGFWLLKITLLKLKCQKHEDENKEKFSSEEQWFYTTLSFWY